MTVRRFASIAIASLPVGLVVYLLCLFITIPAALGAAFFGSETAVTILEVMVEFPLRVLHLPRYGGAFFAAAVWALLAMGAVCVVVVWKSAHKSQQQPKQADI
jgi:hypothetical protein